MSYVEIGLLLVGLCLLVLGYRRSDRNVLLVAALLLLAAGTIGSFSQGLVDGVRSWAS
ncbi:MAG: hypothetical protein HIU89_16900 [Proteobacteria bacterium]|nr:hypothetical protein [Pseudomonadota bacterium]